MIGYRSISEEELFVLVDAQNPVYGRRSLKLRRCTTCDLEYGVVCFFREPYRWKDKKHYIDIQVELKSPILGEGIYQAPKSLEKTKVWTGREGEVSYTLPEAYVRCYFPEQVVSIDIHDKYPAWFVESVISPFCEKYHVKLLRNGSEVWLGSCPIDLEEKEFFANSPSFKLGSATC